MKYAPLNAFFVALIVFGATAANRLRRQSPDPHFVLLADAWLHGRLDIAEWPSGADDPAKVEEVLLKDGSLVRGRRISRTATFRQFGGREIAQSEIKETRRTIHHVSFPPLPAVLLLPQVLIHGRIANDVGLTVVFAALIAPAFILLLRRLGQRTPNEQLWLTGLLCFGTVLYFSSVQGRVWFTAHVIGVLLATLYAWAAIGASRPLLAGLFVGLAFATRPPMLFMVALFLFEAWRAGRPGLIKRLALFATPIVIIGMILAWHNSVRFGEPFEFGHSYLAVRQQHQIERFGLFDFRYLSRNLSVALALLPDISTRPPFISISGHGLAMWFTTPPLLLLLWPRARGSYHLPLWLTVLPVAIWSLLYQNSGWIQFGYRFSLDYMVFLLLLLAVSGRPFGRAFKALVVVAVVINLFGAITFNRQQQFYRSDNQGYGCVVPH